MKLIAVYLVMRLSGRPVVLAHCKAACERYESDNEIILDCRETAPGSFELAMIPNTPAIGRFINVMA